MHALSRSLLLALAGLTGASAHAQAPTPGRLLASNCFQCHGSGGAGPGFDRLAGKPAKELLEELREFRNGQGNSLMSKHSLIYTDAQLRLIADWFAAQPAARSGR
jgi:cytochrome subunit of sulfide dehydrogenase